MAAVNGYQGNTPAETTPAAAGSKQPAPPTKTVDSQSVLKRFFLFSDLWIFLLQSKGIFFWIRKLRFDFSFVYGISHLDLSISCDRTYASWLSLERRWIQKVLIVTSLVPLWFVSFLFLSTNCLLKFFWQKKRYINMLSQYFCSLLVY